ncbi:hypothetical protein [Metabacillus litoralis]|uniref:hypothetical protein n=1 Tax=Metabacillus litoralis TaxID=152268 RepID=UPI000EF5B319|nr:hypothetical protein [Metabacillus litoralis]
MRSKQDVSRYKENRDRKREKQARYVSIHVGSGQKLVEASMMCLDIRGIGTENVRSKQEVSRYMGNWDRKCEKQA